MAIRDFTKLTVGTPTRGERKIEKCPNCGRNGEARQAMLGAIVYLHTAAVIVVEPEQLKAIEVCRVYGNLKT